MKGDIFMSKINELKKVKLEIKMKENELEKSEVTAFKKEKDDLYSQIIEIRNEVEQAESVRSCIEKLQRENRELT